MPPGNSASRNANRNQIGLIPKNSPKPPHTPAIMRLRLDRRKGCLASVIIDLQVFSVMSL
jgi:hypothetical protein